MYYVISTVVEKSQPIYHALPLRGIVLYNLTPDGREVNVVVMRELVE